MLQLLDSPSLEASPENIDLRSCREKCFSLIANDIVAFSKSEDFQSLSIEQLYKVYLKLNTFMQIEDILVRTQINA